MNRRQRRKNALWSIRSGVPLPTIVRTSGLRLEVVKKIARGDAKHPFNRFARLRDYQADFYRHALSVFNDSKKGQGLARGGVVKRSTGFLPILAMGYVDPRKHGTGRLTGLAPEEQRLPRVAFEHNPNPEAELLFGKVDVVVSGASALPFSGMGFDRMLSKAMDHRLDAARLQALKEAFTKKPEGD